MVYMPVWMYAQCLCMHMYEYAPEGMLLRELSFPIYFKVLSNSIMRSGSFGTSVWSELSVAERLTCKHTLSLSSWSVWWCPTCYISFKGLGTATRSPRQPQLRAEKIKHFYISNSSLVLLTGCCHLCPWAMFLKMSMGWFICKLELVTTRQDNVLTWSVLLAFMWKSSGMKMRGQKAEEGNLERCGRKISYLPYACSPKVSVLKAWSPGWHY